MKAGVMIGPGRRPAEQNRCNPCHGDIGFNLLSLKATWFARRAPVKTDAVILAIE